MVQILPYILPLLLGRTFNLDKMQIGVDIFPKKELNRKVIIQNPVTESHYKLIDNMVMARNFLDVGGSFSLNVKGGMFKAGASGEYLKDSYNREKTVEIAVKATYQTLTEQLPADAKPIDTWKALGDALGTHFVRSITYGGELIASVRMECNNTRDKQKIKGAFDVGGRIDIFDIGLEVEGQHMKDISKSVESTQIKVFSSIPLGSTPIDMLSLKQTIDNFPDDMAKFNEGKGIPLKMELWPLSVLDASRPTHIRNRVLEANLHPFERKFDDLLNTKTAITDWLEIMIQSLTDDQEKKVGSLFSEVQKTLRQFYDVIGSLDMTKGTDQLRPAQKAYGDNLPGTFYRKYLLLREEIAKDQGDWSRSKGNGVTYVHWGKKNCSEIAEQMYGGVVFGPDRFGSGSNFLCVPNKPEFKTVSTDGEKSAILQGMSYLYPNKENSKLFCSTCRLGAKGSVQVFSGRTTCPYDWDYIYDGLLMSGSDKSMPTSFVCLDKDADKNSGFISNNPVVPNWSLFANKQDSQMLYPCTVCAK